MYKKTGDNVSRAMRAAWDLFPDELHGHAGGGGPGARAHLFGRLQRPWTWRAGRPDVGRAARAWLDAQVDCALPRIVSARRSADGATKLALEVGQGARAARIEAVHMPRDVRTPRVTLCVSSQVGCAMGCGFCATASMGLVRNLTAAEIVAQVLVVIAELGPRRGQELSLVFMGMGEPLHNVANVTRAIAILCHASGLGVAPSRVTVSTSGLVPGIDALARAVPRPLLALSVNATTDEARARSMPVTRTWGLADLRAALERWPLRPHEKITLEYVLMDRDDGDRGVEANDTTEDVERLAAFARGLRHVVNVIPYNAYDGARFREPSEARVQRFVRGLQERGCLVTVRRSRGRDVSAACGLLATGSIVRA
jgi:23S rRNA (adenine2503-C2)-methyltransferase